MDEKKIIELLAEYLQKTDRMLDRMDQHDIFFEKQFARLDIAFQTLIAHSEKVESIQHETKEIHLEIREIQQEVKDLHHKSVDIQLDIKGIHLEIKEIQQESFGIKKEILKQQSVNETLLKEILSISKRVLSIENKSVK